MAKAKKKNHLETGEEKVFLLLVGVSEYEDKKNLHPLNYAEADCQELATAFTEATQKFNNQKIFVHHKNSKQTPDLAAVRNSLQEIVTSANPQDKLIVYFSCHGILHENQQAVLCLTNTQTQTLANSLTMQELLTKLNDCPAKQQLVILDACHSGGLTLRGINLKLVETLQQQAKEQARQKKNFYALLSCDEDQQSWEFSELGHGVFTYYLIRGLQGEAADSEGIIEVKGLYKYVYHRTLAYIDKLNQQVKLINQQKSSRGEQDIKPENPLQTPKLIVEAVGEMILGLKSQNVSYQSPRQALIVVGEISDTLTRQLSTQLANKGNFQLQYWHPQARNLPDLYSAIQTCLGVDAEAKSKEKSTTLLYLRGEIETSSSGESYLIINENLQISRTWLRKQLRHSKIEQQILILDFPQREFIKEWLEDLRLESESSQCILAGTSNSDNSEAFTQALCNSLTTVNQQNGLAIASWIYEIQKQIVTSTSKPEFWLSGVQDIIEIIPSASGIQGIARNVDLGICPYLGLRAFREQDAVYFYGRKSLTQKLINHLAKENFLAVVGASGSGKSSVLQAGLMAQIRQGKQIPGSEQWWCKSFRPGQHPLQSLARILADEETSLELSEGLLLLGGESFVCWLRKRPEQMVVLVVDQFEELFTLSTVSEREKFFELVSEALIYASDKFKLAIALRSDFISACLEVTEISAYLQQHSILVPPTFTDIETYREVIIEPAKQVELTVETELVNVLLDDLENAAVNLPLLEFVLEKLWEERDKETGKLTLAAYQEKIGGLKGALERKAQEVYENLSIQEQNCAEWIFLSLIQLGERTEDTRRRINKSALFVPKYSPELVEKTLQKFIEAKLIVINQEDNEQVTIQSKSLIPQSGDNNNKTYSLKQKLVNFKQTLFVKRENLEIAKELTTLQTETTVEVAHEILIRHWSTLRWWLAENRQHLRELEQIKIQTKEWQKNNEQEDYLLRGKQLKEAENFYLNYRNELDESEQKYVQLSRRVRTRNQLRVGGISAAVVLIFSSLGILTLKAQQQTRIEQILANIDNNVITPNLVKEITEELPNYYRNGERYREERNVESAMGVFQRILYSTNTINAKSQGEKELILEIKIIEDYRGKAEKSLAELIREYILPQLEAELKAGNFGRQLASDSLADFENAYEGALKISYAILLREKGVKADWNNDGYLTELREAQQMPCETLKEIEELWKKYTENRCSWYGETDAFEAPQCRELEGETLTVKLSLNPAAISQLEERLGECKLIPVEN
ncbi:MAG: caspase family protein [Oscillatoria sp. PMC 1068.18]|nr:caspase family protein [Oscillatoria sp. PMC 1076.18]MEC4990664.1 caspase family protein [Oscillatoria sp. PMC 1068.18]